MEKVHRRELETRLNGWDLLPGVLTAPSLSSAHPSRPGLWIVNLPVNEYLFCVSLENTRSALWRAGTLSGAARFPSAGDLLAPHGADCGH